MRTRSPEQVGIALARAGVSAIEADAILNMMFSDVGIVGVNYELDDARHAYAKERLHTFERGRRNTATLTLTQGGQSYPLHGDRDVLQCLAQELQALQPPPYRK